MEFFFTVMLGAVAACFGVILAALALAGLMLFALGVLIKLSK